MTEPNPNLTGALRASLQEVESPLSEVTTDSVDILLDRLNSAMAEGMPHQITDEELSRLVNAYRAEALRWEQEEEIKKTKARSKTSRKPLGEIIDIDL